MRKADSPTTSQVSLSEQAAQIEELKRECEARERKAHDQVEDIKSKSQRMVALLQLQLTDTNSKVVSEKEKFETEIAELEEQLRQERALNEELNQTLASLKDEVATLLESIRQKGEELEQVREELRINAEIVSSQQQQQQPLTETPFLRPDMFSTSPSEAVQSPMQSLSTIPLRALEEEAFDSSADLEKSNVFPLSLEHSLISMDPGPLGSPLQSQVPSGAGSFLGAPRSTPPFQASPPPHASLSMLAMSRLSHHSSSMPQVSVC